MESADDKQSSEGIAQKRVLETMTPSSIPVYLRNSDFGASMDYDDNEQFSVPSGLTKATTDVHSVQDLDNILATVRFWGLRELPLSVLKFTIANNSKEVLSICEKYIIDLPEVATIAEVLKAPRKRQIAIAMQKGYLGLVKYLFSLGHKLKEASAADAIKNEHVDCLKFALSVINPCSTELFTAAVACRNVAIMRVLLHFYADRPVCGQIPFFSGWYQILPWSLCDVAACVGDVEYIRKARERGWKCYSRTLSCAAAHGHLDCLKYFVSKGYASKQYVVEEAVKNKHFGCAVYAMQNRTHHHMFSFDLDTFTAVVAAGELACLALMQPFANKIVFKSIKPCLLAAQQGHLDCLTFLHEHDYRWDSSVTTAAAEKGHYDCLWYAVQQGCEVRPRVYRSLATSSGGETLLLQLARCEGEVQLDMISVCAAERGYLDCLKYLAVNGCEKTAAVCASAAAGGQLSTLQYLHQSGFPMDQRTTLSAARRGHFDCLEYALEKHCPVNVYIFTYLAERGELRLLQMTTERYAKQHSTSSSYRGGSLRTRMSSVTAAAQHGHLACLRYLVEQCGFPAISSDVSSAAVRHDQWECARYLKQWGCVFTKTAARKLSQHMRSV